MLYVIKAQTVCVCSGLRKKLTYFDKMFHHVWVNIWTIPRRGINESWVIRRHGNLWVASNVNICLLMANNGQIYFGIHMFVKYWQCTHNCKILICCWHYVCLESCNEGITSQMLIVPSTVLKKYHDSFLILEVEVFPC